MPSGDDPMGEHRFSLAGKRGRAFARRSCSNNSWSAMVIILNPSRSGVTACAYRDLISRQRAARSPVKASRRSSIGQALPR